MAQAEYKGSDLERRVGAILAESAWIKVLTQAEIDTLDELTERLDFGFAYRSKEFWKGRTIDQLEMLKGQAWNASDADTYQKARSYLALARTA